MKGLKAGPPFSVSPNEEAPLSFPVAPSVTASFFWGPSHPGVEATRCQDSIKLLGIRPARAL
jgi:hypothetical protein